MRKDHNAASVSFTQNHKSNKFPSFFEVKRFVPKSRKGKLMHSASPMVIYTAIFMDENRHKIRASISFHPALHKIVTDTNKGS